MFPDMYSNRPVQIAKAKRAISSYAKTTNDPEGEAELMIIFVECGTNFTLRYGGMYEEFYDALNGMYTRAINKIISLEEERRIEFKKRLKEILTSSSGIGWDITTCC